MCEVSYNWTGTDGFEVKSETERSLQFVHVVVKILNLVISRSSFDEYAREKMFKKACSTCSTIILVLLTNNFTAFWR